MQFYYLSKIHCKMSPDENVTIKLIPKSHFQATWQQSMCVSPTFSKVGGEDGEPASAVRCWCKQDEHGQDDTWELLWPISFRSKSLCQPSGKLNYCLSTQIVITQRGKVIKRQQVAFHLGGLNYFILRPHDCWVMQDPRNLFGPNASYILGRSASKWMG